MITGEDRQGCGGDVVRVWGVGMGGVGCVGVDVEGRGEHTGCIHNDGGIKEFFSSLIDT